MRKADYRFQVIPASEEEMQIESAKSAPMKLEVVRKKYPQYDGVSDGQLAVAIHQKFYSKLPMGDFADRIGLNNDDFKVMASTLKAMGIEPTSRTASSDNQTELGKTRAASRGATFGFGDEIVSGLRAPIDAICPKKLGEAYIDNLNAERQRLEDYRSNNPKTAAVTEVVGSLAAPLGAMTERKVAAGSGMLFRYSTNLW